MRVGKHLVAGWLLATVTACESGPMEPGLSPCAFPGRAATGVLPLRLQPGDGCVIPVSSVRELRIPASDASTTHLLIVQNTGRHPEARRRIQLTISGPDPDSGAEVERARLAPLLSARGDHLANLAATEATLRSNARRAVATRRSGAPSAAGAGTRREPARDVVAGDAISFHLTVRPDLSVSCDDPATIDATVRAVGEGVAIAEDNEVSGSVSSDVYREIVDEIESLVLPTVKEYFGEITDLDSNGLIWVLFTPAVNRLTPRGSTTRIGGFFNPLDLADPASCDGSNHSEVLYTLAADPAGRFSNPVTEAAFIRRAVPVVAHEAEHLVAAGTRVILEGGSFADLEDAWLSEGLAHTAETLVGLRVGDLRQKQGYGFQDLVGSPGNFGRFFFNNFERTAYFLSDPENTQALGDADGGDPGGIESLKMRGFAWLLVRWLADQPSGQFGIGDAGLLRDLVGGGASRARGVENIERILETRDGPQTWEELLQAFAMAPLRDVPLSDIGDATFDLVDVYSNLHRVLDGEAPFTDTYPLVPHRLTMTDDLYAEDAFDLEPGTGRYYFLESAGPHPTIRIRLNTPDRRSGSGAADPRYVVVRIR